MEVGINGKKLNHHFPELCCAIVEKYRKQHGNHWAGIGKAMDMALKENPPPSVLSSRPPSRTCQIYSVSATT